MNIETLIGFGRCVKMEGYTGRVLSVVPFAMTPSENGQSLILVQEFVTNELFIVHIAGGFYV